MSQLPPFDPLDVAASTQEIRATWLEIMELPVAANDGKVFQYDLVSERLMKNAVTGWDTANITSMDWRLNDNTVVNIDKTGLQAYIDELELNRALRGFQVDQQYVAFKASGATKRDLINWKASYIL